MGHHAVEVEEESPSLVRRQVPDRAPEEGDEPPSLARHPVDVEVEVPHHGVDQEPWVLVGQRRWRQPTTSRR